MIAVPISKCRSVECSATARGLNCFSFFLIAFFAGISAGLCGSQTWDNGAGGFTWDTISLNWSGSAWQDGNDALFGATGVGAITVGDTRSVSNLYIAADGYSFSGGTLDNAKKNGAVAWGITNNTTISSGLTFSFTSSSGAFSKSGPGKLTLAGNLLVTGFNASSASGGTWRVNPASGTALELTNGSSVTFTNALLRLNGSTTISGGTHNFLGSINSHGIAVGDPTTTVLTVSGGSVYTVKLSLAFGTSSIYTQSGGVVTVSPDAFGVLLGSAGASTDTSTLNLDGGTLVARQIAINTNGVWLGTATINLNGGTFRANGQASSYGGNIFSTTNAGNPNLGNIYVKAGGAIIDSAGFNLTNGQALQADPISTGGGLTKLGAGSLTIVNPDNTYTGPTTVSGGTLQVNGMIGTNTVTVQSGANLSGTGTVNGPIAIQSGGTLAPGDAGIGTLNCSNSVTLQSGSQTFMRISKTGGVPISDKLYALGSVTYGGTLTVTNVTSDASAFVAGDSFALFNAASFSGGFTMTNLPVLPSGLTWVWSPTNGTLVVSDAALYVSPLGDDSAGNGSIGNPWRSVAAARDYIRTAGLNTNMSADIVINLRGGRYPLTQTLGFGKDDSGVNDFYITYQSYSNEVATISGGVQVTNWSPVAGKPYWVASVPTNVFGDYFRQLYVNGVRAERARSGWITGVSFFNDPGTPQTVDGVEFNAADLKSYSNVTDLRLLHIEEFKVDEFPVTGITTNATNGLIQVALQQPYCQTRYDYGARYFAATDEWMFVQAFEELDEPGEWYLNRSTHEVYYYPYSFENMATAEVYAPVVRTLLSFTGDSTTSKVENLRFRNLVFEHGNWLFPGKYFIGGSQAEILYPNVPANSSNPSYGYEVPGQIVLNNTKGLQFIGNTIRHMGNCGIQLYNGARDTLIQGNTFFDLTGAAVLGGRYSKDAVIPNQEICTNTIVSDNVIRNIGMDFMAATAIDNLRHYGFQVLHNDLADSQYMGFHERTDNTTLATSIDQGGTVVSFNRISLANAGARYGVTDCGYIYSFGVWPDSVIQGNDINDLNCTVKDTYGMYFDNSSYGLTALSNVMQGVKSGRIGYNFVRALTNNVNFSIENYGDATTNYFVAVSNVNFHSFTGALPVIAQGIVDDAGLEPGYTNLLNFIYAGTNLARGKFAWASGQYNVSTPPSAAVDWDYTTIWAPESGSTNGWWAVDLGAPYVIQRIEIAARTNLNQPSARCDFQVQGANDSGFANAVVLSEQGSVPFAYKDGATYKGTRLTSSWIKYINNPQGFRYLRVIKTASGTLNFSEFQAYGYRAAAGIPTITGTVSDGKLVLSWPAENIGWRLETQTNTLTANNWFTIPASTTTNSVSVSFGGNVPAAVFFRLAYP